MACIECMVTSDNVVRAGFSTFPEILRGVPLNKNVYRYTPPIRRISSRPVFSFSYETVTFTPVSGPSIFLYQVFFQAGPKYGLSWAEPSQLYFYN
ncbi:mannose-6-phosphate isomerase 1-like protein [Carex littledalei]|uniref:Mannose-6-phosphate isomerase 1-like protein n=1 Tax=Carex littledalei TaxID=544730 RepID=A0A833Q9X8_9POAL|nr:mannose-6-phosphate isomerase 1-like protein [Carex littledalei]